MTVHLIPNCIYTASASSLNPTPPLSQIQIAAIDGTPITYQVLDGVVGAQNSKSKPALTIIFGPAYRYSSTPVPQDGGVLQYVTGNPPTLDHIDYYCTIIGTKYSFI